MTPTPARYPLLTAPTPPLLLAARVPSRLPLDTVVVSDALAFLRGLPDNSIDCVVTSPPYFGLRDYGVEGQIGLEPTPAEFVATMVTVFREVRRVLKASGTVWLNLGDSYSGSGKGGNPEGSEWSGFVGNKMREQSAMPSSKIIYPGLKCKDLMMIPARVAIALQDDGWYLRSEVVWSKPNPMPESVTDRPTKAHEMVYLLTKSPRYFYDADAVREPQVVESVEEARKRAGHNGAGYTNWEDRNGFRGIGGLSRDNRTFNPAGRNRRSVWTVTTEPTPFAHFATFPRKLIEPMILAGCPVGGVVLDMFMGSGTVALVARHHNRHFVGCDLNPAYVALARERLRQPFEAHYIERDENLSALPLFAPSARDTTEAE